MAKIQDTKYNYQELLTKGSEIEVTSDYGRIEKMANGDLLGVYLSKGALSPTNPPKDEIGFYIKFSGRTFKISLEEV